MRKKLYIDKSIQKPLVNTYLLLFIAGYVVLGLIFLLAFKISFSSIDLGEYARHYADTVFMRAEIIYLLFFVIYLPISYFIVLKISNRVAGPLTRIERALEEGDIENIKALTIRDKDLLHNFLEVVKNFVNGLK